MSENITPDIATSPAFEYLKPRRLTANKLLGLAITPSTEVADVILADATRMPVSPETSITVVDEFSPGMTAKREEAWRRQFDRIVIFKDRPGELQSAESSALSYAVTDKLFLELGNSEFAEEHKRRFINIVCADGDVQAIETEWERVTANGDEVHSYLNGRALGYDSRVGRIDYAARKDNAAFTHKLIKASRERAERFTLEHAGSIREAVDGFLETSAGLFEKLGIKVDPELIRRRFEEVKERVVITSYLDYEMPANAAGVYFGRSHSILLNADIMDGLSKEQVKSVVFHELFHAVSSKNNVSCKTEAGEERWDIGVGIPHASWLTEGVTEYLARLANNPEDFNGKNASEAYNDDVEIVVNILQANPKIRKLLLEGNFENTPDKKGKIQDTKTHRAIAAIESVYGKGFIGFVEKTLEHKVQSDEEKKSTNEQIERIKQYTKKPERARKVIAISALIIGAGGGFGLATGTAYNEVSTHLNEHSDMKAELDQRRQAESMPMWEGLTAESVAAIVQLNTDKLSTTKLAFLVGSDVVVYENDTVKYYKEPIYFNNGDDLFVMFQDAKNGYRITQLGKNEGYEAYIRASDNALRAVTPVVKDGKLIDAQSGNMIGLDYTEERKAEEAKRLEQALKEAKANNEQQLDTK